MTHITSGRNFIIIGHATIAVFVPFWLVLPFREGRILYILEKKTFNCVVFINFQHSKLFSFQNRRLGFTILFKYS